MYQWHRLSNGIRIIHRHTNSQVAHSGLIINTGSRDEEVHEQGLAHFIEHVIFKGTRKRKAFQVLSHMENVGGEINAYTSKEDTCIYGSFMSHHYERWLDVLSDILFQSVFPAKEVNKEKDIIIDEINSYLDSPAEQIHDDFDELIFNDHPLGRNILGTPESINALGQNHINQFINRNYVTHEMVICSLGQIDFKKLVYLAEKYFGDAAPSQRVLQRTGVSSYKPTELIVNRQNHQVHCVLGSRADSLSSNRKTAIALLNNILGGPGMNSRLNMSVREKHGCCYNIESNYQPYTDSGLISIYFGTDIGFAEKTVSLIKNELARLRNQQLGNLQLKRAKMQLIGQTAISFESNLNEMLYNAKNFLHFNKTHDLKDINQRIEAVERGDLLELANELLADEQMSLLIYKPNH